MQLSEGGGVMIPSNALTSSHFCICPQPVPGFPMPYVMVFFCVQLFETRAKNEKVIERDKIDTSNKQIHERSLSWLSIGTSIKGGSIKLVLWA
jgi:hypothetical protein